MSKISTSFLDKCLAGEALADEVDDYVDLWHEGEGEPQCSLAAFLGFNEIEYRLWAEKPHLLSFILNARRNGVPLNVNQSYDEEYRLAARGLPTEDAEELFRWLKKIGELPN